MCVNLETKASRESETKGQRNNGWVGKLTTCLKVAVSDAVLEVRAAQPLQRGVPHGDLPGFPELRRRLAGLHRRSQTTHKHAHTCQLLSVSPLATPARAVKLTCTQRIFNFERMLP
jgi:hypothetical protein